MSTATATATVEVPCDPDTAFDVFTRDIGTWWRRGNHYWNDPDKSQQMRLEPFVGGRLVEVYDLETGEGFEIGRVLVWEPGKRLVFTWRSGNWQPAESTEVEIRFERSESGTRVILEHGGWDRAPSVRPSVREGYRDGWAELLGFYAQVAEVR